MSGQPDLTQTETLLFTPNPQRQLDQIDIASIKFDARSRDDIPAVLKGLQYLYINEPICEKVFTCLEKALTPKTDPSTGRPGMEL
ncbi:hypothetical protein MNBD_GAMMA13-212 [hydrothermal vent metagenome]|uniref:Uncharacterized protein n=1 Tax=hydrothermal vent metagenome TaxID=652676 RepID=A0A3B0YFK2_9ZZZZ